MVFEDLRRIVGAGVCRILELDPDLAVDDAIGRMVNRLQEDGIAGPEAAIVASTKGLARQGILNPSFQYSRGAKHHFFLSATRPGYLKHLGDLSAGDRSEVSQYILYGEWDTLVVSADSDLGAERLRESLETSSQAAPLYFPARRVLAGGCLPSELRESDLEEIPPDAVAAVLEDFDREDLLADRQVLCEHAIVIGSRWRIETQSPYPLMAFVGLTQRGRGAVSDGQFLRTARSNDLIRRTLADFYVVDQGRPFHYVAKFECLSSDELDEVTTAIGSISIDAVTYESLTLVVANCNEVLDKVEFGGDETRIALDVDLSDLVLAAEMAVLELPSGARGNFIELDQLQQLSVVKSVVELRSRLDKTTLDRETVDRFESALRIFVQECANATNTPNLTGAIAEATTAVEGLSRRMLSKLAYACLGTDKSVIQSALQLNTAQIRKLSLGQISAGFRVAGAHDAFVAYHDSLTDDWIERLNRFADQRNLWLHDAVDSSYGDVVEDARRIVVEAISLAEWVETVRHKVVAENAPLEVEVAESRSGNGPPRVFISHATTDGRVAERIATGLTVFDIPTWYAEWELQAGDSIVGKISDQLAKTDVLLVVLSEKSVNSRWVRQELNAGLAASLAGQSIVVLPVLIEKCDIPAIIADLLYVDLSADFEDGLMRLVKQLRGGAASGSEDRTVG